MKKIVKNSAETARFAGEFLESLSRGAAATVVGLSGELGSGKTTFVRFVAALLGVKGNVSSPTFVLMKSYELHPKKYERLIHIDAYRLASGLELAKLGFERHLGDPGNLIFIEWPERVADLLPPGTKKIRFSVIDGETRSLEF